MTHDAVKPLSETAYGEDGWLGLENVKVDARLGFYMDRWLLLVFGGVPWQVRLASRTSGTVNPVGATC